MKIENLEIERIKIPKEVKETLDILQQNGYQAYIVGGCVRDILRDVKPQDWDITTNAKPEEIEKAFNKAGFKTFYENKFGTVTVLTGAQDLSLKEVEITPFRTEAKYTDKRHPDEIRWARTLKQDLARRDFTVNTIALATSELKLKTQSSKLKATTQSLKLEVIDLFNGQKDLENKVIRTVGKPEERFNEDALRLMRAVRFAATLDPEKTQNQSRFQRDGSGLVPHRAPLWCGVWEIEEKTKKAIQKNAELLSLISQERIRDELVKIIMSPLAAKGIELLRRLTLLKYVVPELEDGFGVGQNKHHIYQIYQHGLLSLNYACKNNFPKEVRLAALFHDIGKPKTKRGQGPNSTFYGHEIVGAKITSQILNRLRFPRKEAEKIVKLVKYHLFYYNVGEVGDSSVRRLLRKVGQDDIEELLQVRHADRIGSGVPKAEPYKLRHLRYLFEKVSKDPISAKMLKINGNDVMRLLNVPAGPKVGQILSYLLSLVLSEPKKNDLPYLENEVKRLAALSDLELASLAQKAREELEKIETKRDEMTKQKYWVT